MIRLCLYLFYTILLSVGRVQSASEFAAEQERQLALATRNHEVPSTYRSVASLNCKTKYSTVLQKTQSVLLFPSTTVFFFFGFPHNQTSRSRSTSHADTHFDPARESDIEEEDYSFTLSDDDEDDLSTGTQSGSSVSHTSVAEWNSPQQSASTSPADLHQDQRTSQRTPPALPRPQNGPTVACVLENDASTAVVSHSSPFSPAPRKAFQTSTTVPTGVGGVNSPGPGPMATTTQNKTGNLNRVHLDDVGGHSNVQHSFNNGPSFAEVAREDELLDIIRTQKAEIRSHVLVVASLEATATMHKDQSDLSQALHKKLQVGEPNQTHRIVFSTDCEACTRRIRMPNHAFHVNSTCLGCVFLLHNRLKTKSLCTVFNGRSLQATKKTN